MDNLTKWVREELGRQEVNLLRLSDQTGIGYWKLYDALGAGGRGRDLRAEEFMKICRALELDPWAFMV